MLTWWKYPDPDRLPEGVVLTSSRHYTYPEDKTLTPGARWCRTCHARGCYGCGPRFCPPNWFLIFFVALPMTIFFGAFLLLIWISWIYGFLFCYSDIYSGDPWWGRVICP